MRRRDETTKEDERSLRVDITTSELGKDGYTSFAIRKSNLDGDNGIVGARQFLLGRNVPCVDGGKTTNRYPVAGPLETTRNGESYRFGASLTGTGTHGNRSTQHRVDEYYRKYS
ncbi:hypothetical protein PV325_008207 [Microctonus aethiopoides]|nr:hypothetical protein PV325_008207 [Microctonus aethiopoides]